MKSKLFRQQATDRLTSPERVNDYVRVTGLSVYVLLAALLACVVALCLWIGYGTVNEFVKVQGVAFPHDGIVRVHTPHEGIVTQTYVRPGSFVRQGERLLHFSTHGAMEQVTAPQSGIVLSLKGEHDTFQPFETCASLYPQDDEGQQLREVRAFVTFADLRKLRVGMPVQVSPADLSREEHGYMHGRIADIASYPTARAEAVKAFHSEDLAAAVLPKEGAAFEVKVLLDAHPTLPGSLRWSHQPPAHADVRIGTFCSVQILTRRRPILDLLSH